WPRNLPTDRGNCLCTASCAKFATYMDPPRDVKGDSKGKTRVGTDAVIYPYMDSSRPASRKLMTSDSEPRAYMRPLLGERPPGPDVLRSLSSQRPHGIDVPRI